MASTTWFDDLEVAPPNAIFHLKAMCQADTSPFKADLGIGAYRDHSGKPVILQAVQKAEAILASNLPNKEYGPIAGSKTFQALARTVLFGDKYQQVEDGKIVSVQALSGTGALRLGFEFLHRNLPADTPVYMSDPTWANHPTICQHTGIKNVCKHRYYKPETNMLDFEGMMEDLTAAPDGAIVLLHPCAHNPTGIDATQEQWFKIAELVERKNFFTFFDIAYQGFATGSFENDSWPIRMFIERGIECLIAQSFAKNMGLYGERVGALHSFSNKPQTAAAVLSQIQLIVRPMYSNPPIHGAAIVTTILSNPELRKQWMDEVKDMADDLTARRAMLYKELNEIGCPGTWEHIIQQIGMFSFTGLKSDQVDILKKEHHIYMLNNGRVSVAGINPSNAKRIAEAFKAVGGLPTSSKF